MLRRLLIAAVLVAGFAAVASPHAHAASISCPDPQAQSLSDTHFSLTYNDDPTTSKYVSQSQAQTILAGAEQAYTSYVAMGFAAPWGGAQMEIDIDNLTAQNYAFVFCGGGFVFDSSTVGKDDQDVALYSSVFTQFAISAGVSDDWLIQSLSQWAAYKALGYPTGSTGDLGPWDISLDCIPTVNSTTGVTNATCSKNGFENQGQSRWPFIEYLAEKYGSPAFLTELMGDAGATDGVTGLQTALTAHGSSLTTEWGNFIAKLLTGGWTDAGLNVISPTISATIPTGTSTGDTSPQTFRVGHLGARFVQIDRGDGSAGHKCYTATLTITVTMSPGLTSQPVFYWAAAGSAPVPLTVSGSTATATLPWDTCQWSSHGYLSLPNETTSVDDGFFTVSTHLDVTTTETTATPPSTPANGYGSSTDTTAAIGALKISLRGPSTLKLSPTDGTLDLVVEATDQGTVSARLGALNLGTKTVEPGMNALHFTIPAGATGTLTLTPASGTPVTMTVARATPSSLSKLKRKANKKPTVKFASKSSKKPKSKK